MIFSPVVLKDKVDVVHRDLRDLLVGAGGGGAGHAHAAHRLARGGEERQTAAQRRQNPVTELDARQLGEGGGGEGEEG